MKGNNPFFTNPFSTSVNSSHYNPFRNNGSQETLSSIKLNYPIPPNNAINQITNSEVKVNQTGNSIENPLFTKIESSSTSNTNSCICVNRKEFKVYIILGQFNIIFEVSCYLYSNIRELKLEIVAQSKSIESLKKFNLELTLENMIIYKQNEILAEDYLVSDYFGFMNGDIVHILVLLNNHQRSQLISANKKSICHCQIKFGIQPASEIDHSQKFTMRKRRKSLKKKNKQKIIQSQSS